MNEKVGHTNWIQTTLLLQPEDRLVLMEQECNPIIWLMSLFLNEVVLTCSFSLITEFWESLLTSAVTAASCCAAVVTSISTSGTAVKK